MGMSPSTGYSGDENGGRLGFSPLVIRSRRRSRQPISRHHRPCAGGAMVNQLQRLASLPPPSGLSCPLHTNSAGQSRPFTFWVSSVLCRIPALPEEKISTIQFPNKFQYSNSKNQTENRSVCDLKFGSEIYLEIGLWKFGRT